MTKIFLATPAFDGKVHVQYAVSFAETFRLLAGYGIPILSRIVASGSLLVAERNRLLQAFWESDCTHILFIDSDLGWPAECVKSLLDKNEDFVAGCYPARVENCFLFRPVFNEDMSIVKSDKQLLEMEYVPAGFMLIRRNVIAKMREQFPELYFEPKHPDSAASRGFCFFNTEVWKGEFWGEDYYFCRKVREAGFRIWVDPVIEFDHAGKRAMLLQALTNKKEDAMKPLEEKDENKS